MKNIKEKEMKIYIENSLEIRNRNKTRKKNKLLWKN
jgi:hypothetical protein